MLRLALAIVIAISVSGCNSYNNYSKNSFQKLSIHTPGVEYARCTLETNKNKYVALSPQVITVERSEQPISVVCEKANYTTGVEVVDSIVKKESAQFKYPDAVIVKMHPMQQFQKDSLIASAAHVSSFWQPIPLVKQFETPVVVPPKEVKEVKPLK